MLVKARTSQRLRRRDRMVKWRGLRRVDVEYNTRAKRAQVPLSTADDPPRQCACICHRDPDYAWIAPYCACA